MSAKPYFSEEHRCWFMPVATPVVDEMRRGMGPVEIRFDGSDFWITRLKVDMYGRPIADDGGSE